MDWSRCFVSILIVDAAATPSYIRARLTQRLADGAAAWNGMGRILEISACSSGSEPEEPIPSTDVQRAASDFGGNVGLKESEIAWILRKLGSGIWTDLSQEDLREHDVIVALDSEAAAATQRELAEQGVSPEGRLLSLSDLEWYLAQDWGALTEALCVDGSGETFLPQEALETLRLHAFEFGAAKAAEEFDVPPWPTRPLGLRAEDGNLGEWRRLYSALLRGSWGLVWFLFKCWKQDYCNPLGNVLDHADAIREEPAADTHSGE